MVLAAAIETGLLSGRPRPMYLPYYPLKTVQTGDANSAFYSSSSIVRRTAYSLISGPKLSIGIDEMQCPFGGLFAVH